MLCRLFPALLVLLVAPTKAFTFLSTCTSVHQKQKTMPPTSSASTAASRSMIYTTTGIRRRIIGDVWAEQQRKAQKQAGRFSSFCLLPGCCSPPPPSLLFCSAVTDDGISDASSSDSDFSSSSEISVSRLGESGNSSTSIASSTNPLSWKDKLLRWSNYASLLCVLDCTILPIVTIMLPLLGFVAAPASLEWLHQAGHSIALWFVMPVGFTATTTNFIYNHRTPWITLTGWLGLLLVFASNAHLHLGAHGSILHKFLHLVHHGVAHRVANLTGCALLIASNYWSRKRGCGNANCGHDHHHH